MTESQNLAEEIAAGNGITVPQVAHQQRANPSTIFRWVQKGLPDGKGNRVRLEAIRRGKAWYTSRSAVARFFARLPQSQNTSTAAPVRTPSQRERDSARAAKLLRDNYAI